MKWCKWCPNGCGKKAYRVVSHNKSSNKPYYCPKCGKRISYEKIKELN